MGAWGHESFANDDAMDWVAELEAEGLPAVGRALAAVEDLAGEYLEAPACSSAVAAAEVVAALRGRPAADLPEEVANWVAAHPSGSEELVQAARRAVDAITNRSELRELWEEVPDYELWRGAMTDLRGRLS